MRCRHINLIKIMGMSTPHLRRVPSDDEVLRVRDVQDDWVQAMRQFCRVVNELFEMIDDDKVSLIHQALELVLYVDNRFITLNDDDTVHHTLHERGSRTPPSRSDDFLIVVVDALRHRQQGVSSMSATLETSDDGSFSLVSVTTHFL